MNPQPNPLAAHYALTAARFAFNNGDYQAALTLADEALLLSPTPEVQLWLLRYQGDAHRAMSNYLKAAYQYEQALELARQLGDEQAETQVLIALGRVAGNQGAYRAAQAYYAAVLERYQQRADRAGIAEALNNLGTVCLRRGDLHSAQRYHDESLTIWRQLNEPMGIAASLYALGEVALSEGDYYKALTYMRESLDLYQHSGRRKDAARVLNGIGSAILQHGDIPTALDYIQRSLEMRQLLLDRKGESVCWQNIGWSALKQQEPLRALDAFQRALNIQDAISYRYGSAQTHVYIGFVQLEHDLTAARAHFQEALQVAYRIGARSVALGAVIGMAWWAWQTGNRDKSVEWMAFVRQQDVAVRGMTQPYLQRLEAIHAEQAAELVQRFQQYHETSNFDETIQHIIHY
ncbi:tetratricopeptide repeat protein [Aggregatilineales bacterium SYSU G02658]